MIEGLNPGLILILAGICVPLLGELGRRLFIVLAPIVALLQVCLLAEGSSGHLTLLQLELETLRVDSLSRFWGGLFCVAALLGGVYSLYIKDRAQDSAALIYAGAALGAVFAGDYITLFVFWEMTALSSVILLLAARSDGARAAAIRYLVFQILSGVLLIIGASWLAATQGSIAFTRLPELNGPALVILLAFGVKSAFPLLHNWLHDAYPRATPSGSVILSAFSTKLAIYALARAFPGHEALIWIGALMALLPVFFAMVEDDLRRVLSYSLNSQLGLMVVGVGIGSDMALNGAAGHAMASTFYKGLLFMVMGVVIHRTGTSSAAKLRGLFDRMPGTALACLVGAASIAALPLFSGFVTKSLIISAAAKGHMGWLWAVLLLASAAAVAHTALRLPLVFFSRADESQPLPETHLDTPQSMGVAMLMASVLCVLIGILPQTVYALLPYEVSYAVYTGDHIITQLQLVGFAVLAFLWLRHWQLIPASQPGVLPDSDLLYRQLFPRVWQQLMHLLQRLGEGLKRFWHALLHLGLALSTRLRLHGQTSADTASGSDMALAFFAAFLITLLWLLF